MTPQTRRAIFERLASANPQPTTELRYASPFELLVAVMLSAQATDKGVNKATERLFRVANTPAAIAKLGVDGLIPYVSSIGLYRNKAKHLVAASEIIEREHGGQVPETREALERLPGVGRKTANVVLNTAFGQPTIAVDTHIFRVANRTGLAPGKDVLAVERGLEAGVPEEFRRNAHHWLILHGRYVCVARAPQCASCMLRDLCEYPQKNEVAALTPKRPAPPAATPAGPAGTRRSSPSATSARRTAKQPVPKVPARTRGAQPMAKTARAGARRGRAR
jgi:endonuclease-3